LEGENGGAGAAAGLSRGKGEGKKELLFVNKKKQKNFECRAWGGGAGNAPGPASKNFLVLFLKKNCLLTLNPH
jgi:hypothetical protein